MCTASRTALVCAAPRERPALATRLARAVSPRTLDRAVAPRPALQAWCAAIRCGTSARVRASSAFSDARRAVRARLLPRGSSCTSPFVKRSLFVALAAFLAACPRPETAPGTSPEASGNEGASLTPVRDAGGDAPTREAPVQEFASGAADHWLDGAAGGARERAGERGARRELAPALKQLSSLGPRCQSAGRTLSDPRSAGCGCDLYSAGSKETRPNARPSARRFAKNA